MPSVFLLRSSGSAAVSPTPSGADWDHVNTVSRPMRLAFGNDSLASENYNPDSSDHTSDADSMVAQFVSDVYSAGDIPAQHIGLFLPIFEAQSANDLTLSWKLYVVDTTGVSVLATLIALGRNGMEASHLGFRGCGDVRSCSTQTIGSSFRLVLEAGLGGTPDGAGFQPRHNGSLQLGDPTLSGQPLLMWHNATPGLPMLLFTQGVLAAAPASPAGTRARGGIR